MADGTRTLDEQPAGDESVPWILRQAAERRAEAPRAPTRRAPSPTWPAPAGPDQAWDDDAPELPAPLPRRAFAATGVDALVAGVTDADAHRLRRSADPTATEARRIPRRAWPWLGAGLALVVAASVVQGVVDYRAMGLERNGARVPGVVAEVVLEEDASFVGGEHIVVEFTWQERPRRKEIRSDEATGYREGGPVTVLVDRSNPERVSVLGEANQPPWDLWVAFGVLGGLGLMAVASGCVSATGVGTWAPKVGTATRPRPGGRFGPGCSASTPSPGSRSWRSPPLSSRRSRPTLSARRCGSASGASSF